MPDYPDGSSCPAVDSMGFALSENRSEVLILRGTSGQVHCYNIDDVKSYIMNDTDFPSGLLYNEDLPYPQIIAQILPQVPNDQEFRTKLESILNPPVNNAAFRPPDDFLRLIKRLGQCLKYFNNKGTPANQPGTLTERFHRRGLNLLGEEACRLINFRPYLRAIRTYLAGVDDTTRAGIRNLEFKGYKGRSQTIVPNLTRQREITFGEFLDHVLLTEDCMGTIAGNLITFYNSIQQDEVISTRDLISDADAMRFCPRAEYITSYNNNRNISNAPLFVNEGGRRKRTRYAKKKRSLRKTKRTRK